MTWANVAANIHFWAPGGPSVVNNVSASAYDGADAFSPADQAAILTALQNLNNSSPTA